MTLLPIDEEIHLAYFKVKRSGYYKYREDARSFFTPSEMLNEVREWADGKDLGLTRLYDPPMGSDVLPVYLLGIENVGPDWVLAMWNETPHHKAGVPSIMLNSQVGQAVVHMNGVVNNSRPGFATYFWWASDKDVLASIRFRHNVTGQVAMRDYLRHYLEHESSHVIEGCGPVPTGGQAPIVGYTNLPDNLPLKVYPRFETEAYRRLGGDREYVKANVARITKVIRKGSLEAAVVQDRTMFENVVRFLRRQPAGAATLTASRDVRVELAYTPDAAELEQMIDAEDQAPERAWDDLGFTLKGEPNKVYWVGRSTVRDEITLPILRTNEELVDLKHFADGLASRRNHLLRFV